MDILKSLKWRYATKKFDNSKIVPQEKIAVLLEAFNLTATSYGLQPLKLVVVKNKELQQKLTAASWDQQQVFEASHLLVICRESTINKVFIENYFSNVKDIRATPDEILDPFKNQLIDTFENKTASEISDWASKQAYIALGNLLTVCAIEKIDACPMEGFVAEEYDRLLNLNELGLNTTLVLPIGYRSKDDMFSDFKKVRRPLKDTVISI